MTGIDIVHVPYRGTAPALIDLIAGQVQVVFDNLPGSIGHIKSGKVRALGVTGRSAWLRSPSADHRRNRAGLRGEHLVRHRGAQGRRPRSSRSSIRR